MSLDHFDRVILSHLVENGGATQAELGERANLSGPAAGRRQRALEQDGYISGYRASLNFEKLGFAVLIMVLIQLEAQSRRILAAFEDAVCQCPSILSCHLLSGSEDYLLSLRARDLQDFERIHREELANLPGVSRMQSLFTLREVLDRTTSPAMLREV